MHKNLYNIDQGACIVICGARSMQDEVQPNAAGIYMGWPLINPGYRCHCISMPAAYKHA